MRGENIYKILEFLKEASMQQVDFIRAIISAGYGASLGKIECKQKDYQEKRLKNDLEKVKKRLLQKYIYKLKIDGLITENSSGKVLLSPKGQRKLVSLQKNKLLSKNSYEKESGDRVIIISYDLPVAFNRERDVMRGILKELGFDMVHKSVWVGKVKLPKQFPIILAELKILEYTEVLEVTKNGSLKSIE